MPLIPDPDLSDQEPSDWCMARPLLMKLGLMLYLEAQGTYLVSRL